MSNAVPRSLCLLFGKHIDDQRVKEYGRDVYPSGPPKRLRGLGKIHSNAPVRPSPLASNFRTEVFLRCILGFDLLRWRPGRR